MYKCLECGHLFEDGEEAIWIENRGEFWGSPCSEYVSGCPICKGGYAEIKPCKICGSYEHDIEEEYCNQCKKDVQKRFSNFVSEEFTEEERELLNKIYEGDRI